MIKAYNKADETAPRFRQSSLGVFSRKFFNSFYKKHPEYKKYSEKDIKNVIGTFNEIMYNAIINNRDGVELPEGLGYIFVGSCKAPIKKNVDHDKSIKLGVEVINRNLGSDSYLAKIFYTNYESKYKFKHRKLWKFKGTRNFTNKLSKVYREEWPKYIVVENYLRISALYRNSKLKHYKQKNIIKPVPKDYKEFDFD